VIVTVLGSLFLLLLVAMIFYGYGFVMRSVRVSPSSDGENCLLCGTMKERSSLIRRVLPNGKEVYLCGPCIASLQDELSTPQPAIGQ